jgi:signal transduction histidine kinase
VSTLAGLARTIGHSMSARLVLIFFLASVAYGYAARYAFTLFQDTDYLRRIVGAHTALHSEYILNDIGSPPDIGRAQAIVDKIPVDIAIVGPDLNWSSSPDFWPLDEVPFGKFGLLETGEAGRAEVEDWVKQAKNVEFARYKDHALVKLEKDGYNIVFASPRVNESPNPDYTTLIISLVGIVVLGFCYLAVRWVIKPISWMQVGAARIGGGDLDYRIPTPRKDELGDLSREFNKMADDVQGMLEAKRQLMLAISHELRSPLTRSKVAAEFIEDAAVRRNILDDVDEMERLIADLLESEALNTRHAILRREPLQLDELLEQLIESDFAHEQQRVQLRVAGTVPVAELDATRMRLLFRNLIDNALRYNPPGAAPVAVAVSGQGDGLQVTVADHGPGIAAEHIEHVTEPFYRADPARSRATGGFGLGLYLCRRIVEAHGGELRIMSTGPQGTEVVVQLPLGAA